jgi:hypothetical protein
MHSFRSSSMLAGAIALCSCGLGSGPADNPPLVAITAPLPDADVGGIVGIDAAAADDSRVEKVRILVDGIQLGTDFTVGPYHVTWNTSSLLDGSQHTIRAEATDDADQVGVAQISVTVLNSPQSPPSQRVSRIP